MISSRIMLVNADKILLDDGTTINPDLVTRLVVSNMPCCLYTEISIESLVNKILHPEIKSIYEIVREMQLEYQINIWDKVTPYDFAFRKEFKKRGKRAQSIYQMFCRQYEKATKEGVTAEKIQEMADMLKLVLNNYRTPSDVSRQSMLTILYESLTLIDEIICYDADDADFIRDFHEQSGSRARLEVLETNSDSSSENTFGNLKISASFYKENSKRMVQEWCQRLIRHVILAVNRDPDYDYMQGEIQYHEFVTKRNHALNQLDTQIKNQIPENTDEQTREKLRQLKDEILRITMDSPLERTWPECDDRQIKPIIEAISQTYQFVASDAYLLQYNAEIRTNSKAYGEVQSFCASHMKDILPILKNLNERNDAGLEEYHDLVKALKNASTGQTVDKGMSIILFDAMKAIQEWKGTDADIFLGTELSTIHYFTRTKSLAHKLIWHIPTHDHNLTKEEISCFFRDLNVTCPLVIEDMDNMPGIMEALRKEHEYVNSYIFYLIMDVASGELENWLSATIRINFDEVTVEYADCEQVEANLARLKKIFPQATFIQRKNVLTVPSTWMRGYLAVFYVMQSMIQENLVKPHRVASWDNSLNNISLLCNDIQKRILLSMRFDKKGDKPELDSMIIKDNKYVFKREFVDEKFNPKDANFPFYSLVTTCLTELNQYKPRNIAHDRLVMVSNIRNKLNKCRSNEDLSEVRQQISSHIDRIKNPNSVLRTILLSMRKMILERLNDEYLDQNDFKPEEYFGYVLKKILFVQTDRKVPASMFTWYGRELIIRELAKHNISYHHQIPTIKDEFIGKIYYVINFTMTNNNTKHTEIKLIKDKIQMEIANTLSGYPSAFGNGSRFLDALQRLAQDGEDDEMAAKQEFIDALNNYNNKIIFSRYERIWNENTNHRNATIALLEDYLYNINFYTVRNNFDIVERALEKIKKSHVFSVEDILGFICLAFTSKMPNPDGSLIRRMDFIARKTASKFMLVLRESIPEYSRMSLNDTWSPKLFANQSMRSVQFNNNVQKIRTHTKSPSVI